MSGYQLCQPGCSAANNEGQVIEAVQAWVRELSLDSYFERWDLSRCLPKIRLDITELIDRGGVTENRLKKIIKEIVGKLPEDVVISYDVDAGITYAMVIAT